MPLTHIEYGSLASSEVVNWNFEYLDDRITAVAGNLTSASTNIYSNIASLNSTISGQIDDIEADISDLESGLGDLRNDFDTQNYAPNYANAIAVNYSKGSAVGFNGWLAVLFSSGATDTQVIIKINSIPIGGIGTGSNGGATDTSACIAIVSSTDTITWTGNVSSISFYKIPFLGGE